MDQNKSEGRGPIQPISRGNFTPVGRTFGGTPMPAVQAPAPAPITSTAEPERITFAPQQFTQPSMAPAPAAPVAPVKPLSFAPPAEAPKKPGLISRIKLTQRQRIVAGALAVFLVLAGGIQQHVENERKHILGVKTHGRKIPISDATVAENSLETSCYRIALPNQYQVTHTAGCASVITATKTENTNISLVSTPSASTFDMKDAPTQIKQQLKLLGSEVVKYKTEPTTVDGIKALKVMYQLAKGSDQVLVFVPHLPAKYVANDDPAGAFMIRGTYGTNSQQASFDKVLASLKWER